MYKKKNRAQHKAVTPPLECDIKISKGNNKVIGLKMILEERSLCFEFRIIANYICKVFERFTSYLDVTIRPEIKQQNFNGHIKARNLSIEINATWSME